MVGVSSCELFKGLVVGTLLCATFTIGKLNFFPHYGTICYSEVCDSFLNLFGQEIERGLDKENENLLR